MPQNKICSGARARASRRRRDDRVTQAGGAPLDGRREAHSAGGREPCDRRRGRRSLLALRARPSSRRLERHGRAHRGRAAAHRAGRRAGLRARRRRPRAADRAHRRLGPAEPRVEAGSRAFARSRRARSRTSARGARRARARVRRARPSALLRALWVAVQDDGSLARRSDGCATCCAAEFALARPTPTRAPAEMRDLAIADLELTAGAPAPGPPADDGPATHQPDDAAARGA